MKRETPNATIIAPVQVGEGYETIRFETREWLDIDRHDLDEEAAKQASERGWVNVIAERAKTEAMLLEADLEDLDSDLAMAFSEGEGKELSATGLKEAVKRSIGSSRERRALYRKWIAADDAARQMAALNYAMIDRKEMIVSLAKAKGSELSTPSPVELDRSKKFIMGRK